jgi:hypothetical protein
MKRILLLSAILLSASLILQAQPERVGQAGATQLLINSWARSSGFNGINIGSVSGIESVGNNPGGLAATTGTELIFSHTQWLMGTDISINTFGFSQSLGPNGGVAGLSVMAFSLGDFVRTTAAQPDGTLGTFKPGYVNLGLSYARQFTERIYVGTSVRLLSESTPEVKSSGISFDVGIQYRAGEQDRMKLGLVLRNIGPTMQFGGDGLRGRVLYEDSDPFTTAVELPTEKFELPSVLSLGASYDFFLGSKSKLSMLGSFTSNSFYYDQFGLALEYKWRDYLFLRGGFLYEKGIFGELGEERFSAFTGGSAGATVQIPFKTGKTNSEGDPIFSTIALDISYRTTNPFNGSLGIGARVDL